MSDHALLLRPTGPLDVDASVGLRQQLAAAFSSGVKSIAVDLSSVPVADLTGLGVLAGAARHLRRRGGLLVVTNAQPVLATMMRINGLAELLELPASPPLRVVADNGDREPSPRGRTLHVVRPGA